MRYEPDVTGTAPLVSQLAQDLVQSGADVVVIASLPHYGRKSVHPDYQNRQGFFHRSQEKGVKIIRTPIFVPKNPGMIQRALNYLSYNFYSVIAGLFVEKVDVILAINPPITTTFSAWILCVFHRTPLIVGIQDVWPDCLIQIGKLSNRVLIELLKILERIQYRIASRIIVLSEGMRDNLLRKGVNKDKIRVIPNWADSDEVIPGPKENRFLEEQQLKGYFNVLFAGNHGYIAALEYVIDAASLLKEHPDIQFIFAGEGNAKADLVNLVQNKKILNVRFLPTQSKERWLEMLAAVDIGLVTLRKELANLNVPSKIYTLMSAAVPILASVPGESEIVQLVKNAECGFISPPEDPERLAHVILANKDDRKKLEILGKNGREYLIKNFHRESQTDKYINIIRQVQEG
jgi:colanic acid biosynthesis glycosyl transferase WcaI